MFLTNTEYKENNWIIKDVQKFNIEQPKDDTMGKTIRIVTLTVTIIFSTNILAFAETRYSLENQIEENHNQINDL